MLNHVTRRKSLLALLIVVGMLAIGMTMFVGFATTAGAAALRQPYAPAGATGQGVDAPPMGSEPLIPGVAWDAKNYRIPHHVSSCPQPPTRAVDRFALANSPTLLDYYGLPRPSVYQNDMAKWQSVIATMSHRQCDSSIPVIDGQPEINYDSTQNIWGGWGSNRCTNCYAYWAAQFQVYVPGLQRTSNRTNASVWVGVGGANNNALAQDGVALMSQGAGYQAYAFYESVDCGVDKYEHDLFVVAQSALMYFYTDVNGYDILDDQTTGNYQTTTWGCGGTDSAEFIIERNGAGGAPLANYGTEYAYSAQYEDGANNWWGVDENSGGYGDGFYSWGLYGSTCSCYLETQSTPSTTNHASTWHWTWQNWQ